MNVFDAARYDEWFDRPWGRYAAAIERDALARSVPATANRLLDVGCGTGRLTIAPRNGTVIATDHDEGMLRIARARIAGPLVIADADHLPFARASFDVTTAVTLCEFTSSAEHTIAELARVTRPGGRIIIGALNRRSPWGRVNRAQFSDPPWSSARFLTETDLCRIGSAHGTVTTRSVIYAPAAWPGLRWWGPMLEAIGHWLAPHHGAFVVAAIDLPEP
jgi:ubiquinone/menaquinone biosynthesis C-methylase UbiE